MVIRPAAEVKLIAFACEAGMGSSLMGANQLKKMVNNAGLSIEVIHSAVGQVPENVDVIVTHQQLAKQARAKFPEAVVVPFKMFIGDPAITGLIETLRAGSDVESAI